MGSGHKTNAGIGSQKEFIGSPAPREEEHVTFIYACTTDKILESCQKMNIWLCLEANNYAEVKNHVKVPQCLGSEQ